MRSISIYFSLLAFLAALGCGACQSKEATTSAAISVQSEKGPLKVAPPPPPAKGKRAEGKRRKTVNVSAGEAPSDKADPRAAPPATAGLAAGPALQLDRVTARVGETVSVTRSEPFPSGATVHFGATETKPVKRLDGGRKLSFKVPKNASTGPITVKADGQAYGSTELTIE